MRDMAVGFWFVSVETTSHCHQNHTLGGLFCQALFQSAFSKADKSSFGIILVLVMKCGFLLSIGKPCLKLRNTVCSASV